MTCLRDEVLVAYADNQLRGEKLRAVEHVLAVDVDARHTVALFKLTGCHVRQAFAGIDFTGVPAWFDALFQRNGRHPHCARNAWAWNARGRTPFRWPKLGFALAASLALGICIGGLISAATTPSNGAERLLVLGELPPASTMAEALDHVTETGATWNGPGQWRAAGITSFKDRFGNECQEVEFYSALGGDIPAQIVVACRGKAERWALVGAMTNQVSGAPISTAAIAAYYVPAEEQARPSMDSILSMLGAQHRESTTDRNPNAP